MTPNLQYLRSETEDKGQDTCVGFDILSPAPKILQSPNSKHIHLRTVIIFDLKKTILSCEERVLKLNFSFF